jgi:hypothetical protein
VAVRTLVIHLEFEWVFESKYSLLKCKPQTHLDITSALWTATLLLPATKKLAKDITKTTVTKVEVNILTAKSTKSFEWIAATSATA